MFLGALGLGLVFGLGDLSREAAGPTRDWHKAIGLLVLGWGTWRILWRLVEGFPSTASGTLSWQEVLAKTVHIALLAATVALPVSGVLMSIAGGTPHSVFGLSLLPSLGEIPWLDAAASVVHGIAAPVLIVLLSLHTGGALKHHLIDRDDKLKRMAIGRTRA